MNNPEAGLNLFAIAVLMGGFNGVLFGVLLLWMRRRNFAANRFLAMILIAIGLLLLDRFFIETGLIYRHHFLLGAPIVLEVLFAPAMYLYVRNMTLPSSPTHKTWLHFVPSLVAAALILPFYFLSFDAKLAVVNSEYVAWPGVLATTQPIYMAITGVQFLVYLVLSFRLLFRHSHNIKQLFSYREKITLAWLRNFLLLNVLMFVFFAIFLVFYSLNDQQIAQFMDVFYYLSAVFILFLGIMGLSQRRIYQGELKTLNLADPAPETASAQPDDREPENSNKYKKSALSQEMSAKILTRLKHVMQETKPHLNSSLTLPQLAKMVATSPNNLSQVINEQLEMNFFDFVNSYRIDVAKELLVNPLPHTPTILDIAMEAAFNSKSAFYTAFKKQVGVTPAAFKKHIESSEI